MPHPADPQAILRPFVLQADVRLPMQRLVSRLPAGADVWIIGGALRNAIIEAVYGRSPLTEDIDIFIADIDPTTDLLGLELEGPRRRTELGGIRWFPQDSPFSFDIGLMSEFVMIKKFRLPPTPRAMLGAIDFDVNAVMWHWKRQQALLAGCAEAISRRVMDFNTLRVFDPVLLAYRILLTRHKIRFSLSKRIFDYLKSTLDLDRLKKLQSMLTAKQGKPLAEDVMEDCDAICACASYTEYTSRRAG